MFGENEKIWVSGWGEKTEKKKKKKKRHKKTQRRMNIRKMETFGYLQDWGAIYIMHSFSKNE